MNFLRRQPTAPSTPPSTDLLRVDDRAVLERQLIGLTPLLRRWLYRMLGPSQLLDDAMQDALIALAEALPSLTDGDKLQAFARTITTRVGYRYFSQKPLPALELDDIASAAPNQEALLVEHRERARLYRCLERLPARRRMAFVLCGIEGLSHAEAAALEGTNESAMRARYMHARHELMRMLGVDQEAVHD